MIAIHIPAPPHTLPESIPQPPLHQVVAYLDLMRRTQSEAVRVMARHLAREAQARHTKNSPPHSQ